MAEQGDDMLMTTPATTLIETTKLVDVVDSTVSLEGGRILETSQPTLPLEPLPSGESDKQECIAETTCICRNEESLSTNMNTTTSLCEDVPDIISSAAEALQKSVLAQRGAVMDEKCSSPSLSADIDVDDAKWPTNDQPCTSQSMLPDVSITNIETTAAPPPSPRASSRGAHTPASEYQLKWVKWKGQKIPIITQNENGPCPLIAIMNVLLLKGRIRLPDMAEFVASAQLMEYLVDCILNSLPKNLSSGVQANYEQNMADAIAILPKLQTGLDVNVRFTSVSSFEYTPELIVFDLLTIPLYHGWLVDSDSLEQVSAVSNCSYNQLVDKIISNKFSDRPELVTEGEKLIFENCV